MLEKVIENWTSRLDYIRASRGSNMPELIFKIKTRVIGDRPRNFEPRTCHQDDTKHASPSLQREDIKLDRINVHRPPPLGGSSVAPRL
ncbi:hypothetical protein TNCV_2538641 [Trichonephila clavipes]|nr:hypothetical protein TNCV_2538641 [Trichonephila clavipes]